MITENMTIQGLHIISLALTPIEWWEAAKRYFTTASAAEMWLTVFGVVVLITSVILLFLVRAKYRHIAKLTDSKEKLLQEIAELKREQVDVLENRIDAKPPRKEIPGFNPQEMKALSELAKRLR